MEYLLENFIIPCHTNACKCSVNKRRDYFKLKIQASLTVGYMYSSYFSLIVDSI